MHDSSAVVLSIGVLLIAALLAGQLAYWLRFPRVTAYLLVGMLLGPHTAHLVPEDHLDSLHPFGEMAMALVLFNMGCHFSLAFFRRIMRRAFWLSAGELTLTFVLVVCGTWLAGASWQLALLFGALALATAPATTVLVLKENESEGPVTEFTFALIALNNLAAVIAFEALFVLVVFFSGSSNASPSDQLLHLGIDLSTSLVIGVVAGVIVSYSCEILAASRWLVLLMGIATLVLGICHYLSVPYLLTFLAMGAVVANASERTREISGEMDRITGLLCVVFFVIHGAEMDMRALWAAGTLGAAYIVARSLGKYFGIYFTAERKTSLEVKRYLGLALVSQAGAAIALASIAVERSPDLGAPLQTIILGTVVFFEISGPLLIRRAIIAAGEVPLDKAIRHGPTTPLIEFRRLWNRLFIALGLDPWRSRTPENLAVGDLMRKNFESIPAGGTFDQLVGVLERSHDNVFPVVDAQGDLIGVIRYRELRKAVFDPNLGPLVCAADLAQPARNVLTTDDVVAEAVTLIRQTQDDLLPVVAGEDSDRLVGIVARRDLYRFFLKRSQ
ncbi:MAG: cation:proton antiporter [Planctomycetes bacterium]|nr:cation:proton antiporter [Planctomycetota bacterium]